ncbi:hypothetical protein ACWCQW_33595 [Streptomyces mirabilis]
MHHRRLTRDYETHPQRELALRLASNQTLSQGKALFEYLPLIRALDLPVEHIAEFIQNRISSEHILVPREICDAEHALG